MRLNPKICIFIVATVLLPFPMLGRNLGPTFPVPRDAFTDPNLVEAAEVVCHGQGTRDLPKFVPVNAEGRHHARLLWYAYTCDNLPMFQYLMRNGADWRACLDDRGSSLLEWCAFGGEIGYLSTLLDCGANPNQVLSSTGLPLIFKAVEGGRLHNVVSLVEAGANVNVRDAVSNTPLIRASFLRRTEIVAWLIEHGADWRATNDQGMDLAAGLFGPNWDTKSGEYRWRGAVLAMLKQRGIIFDENVVSRSPVRNIDEATGASPVMWLQRGDREPNPDWVRRYPDEAEKWYRKVLHKAAPSID